MSAKKTHTQYVAEVQEKYQGRVEVLGTYDTVRVKILHRCTVDGHEWETTPHNLCLKGKGCPACNNRRKAETAGRRRGPNATQAEKQKALDLRNSGMTYAQIAQALGRSEGAVAGWCDPKHVEARRESSLKWVQENRLRHRENSRRYNSFAHGIAARRCFQAERRGWIREWYTHCPDDVAAMQAIYLECERLNRETGIEHHVDHIWPLSKGGPHLPFNLQIITAEENLSKKAQYTAADQSLYLARIMEIFHEG